MSENTPIIEVDGLSKEFIINSGIISRILGNQEKLQAVANVSLDIAEGEAVGLVGESGAGKSTVGNLILRLVDATEGEIRYKGNNIEELSNDELIEYRQSVGMVFQDPYSSLDPRYKVGKTIAEPLKVHTSLSKKERQNRVAELLETVNLESDFVDRYPHELSGGQIQRISLATALTLEPEFLVLDEPTSALDVSVKARILNLLKRLQRERGLSYLVISHDLSVVRYITNRVAIMYLGEIIEQGPTADLFKEPSHPYTRGLLRSIPSPNPDEKLEEVIKGEIPSPINPPDGCTFHPRCSFATDVCTEENPPLERISSNRIVSCHHWEQLYDLPEEVD